MTTEAPGNEQDPAPQEKKVEEKKVEPEVKVVQQPYKFQGRTDVDPETADALITRGLKALEDEKQAEDNKQKETKTEEGEDPSKRIAALEERLEQSERREKAAKQHTALIQNVVTLSQGNEFMQKNPELVQGIQEEALNGIYINTNLTPQQALENAVNKTKKIVNSSRAAYLKGKVKDKAATQGEQGSGGDAEIEYNEKATIKDLQSGSARKKLAQLVRSGKAFIQE